METKKTTTSPATTSWLLEIQRLPLVIHSLPTPISITCKQGQSLVRCATAANHETHPPANHPAREGLNVPQSRPLQALKTKRD